MLDIFSFCYPLSACCLIYNLHFFYFHILPESTEGIPSVKKSLLQASSQASKLLHPFTYDYKRLEVSDTKDRKNLP